MPSASTASRPITCSRHHAVAQRRARRPRWRRSCRRSCSSRAARCRRRNRTRRRARPAARRCSVAPAPTDASPAAASTTHSSASRARAEHQLAVARHAAADEPGVAALRDHRQRRARAGAQHRRDLRRAARPHHGRARAAEAPGPVGLVATPSARGRRARDARRRRAPGSRAASREARVRCGSRASSGDVAPLRGAALQYRWRRCSARLAAAREQSACARGLRGAAQRGAGRRDSA